MSRSSSRVFADAERVVAGFVEQARDKVGLEALADEIIQAVDRTVAPTSVAVWLRSEVE